MKVGKVLSGIGAAGVIINACLVRDERGKVSGLKLGPVEVWNRERWNARPMVQRLRARVRGERVATDSDKDAPR